MRIAIAEAKLGDFPFGPSLFARGAFSRVTQPRAPERRPHRARRDGRDFAAASPWRAAGSCAAARSIHPGEPCRCAWARSCGATSGDCIRASLEQLATKIDQIMVRAKSLPQGVLRADCD